MTDYESMVVHPGELTEHPLNSNTHNQQNLEELAESRLKFGQYKNIVTWTPPEKMTVEVNGTEMTLKPGIRYVVAGNGFHQASILRGDEHIEIKDVSHLSHDEVVLLMEMDNASPLGSKLDPEKARRNIERVKDLFENNERLKRMMDRHRETHGITLNGTGNGAGGEDAEPQIDRAAELQEVWGTKLGQVWGLADHRLACGDCTDKAVVELVMDGKKAGYCATDPPYGIGEKWFFDGCIPSGPDYADENTFDLTLIDLSMSFTVWGGQYYDILPLSRNEIGWAVWDKRPDLEGEKRERADRIFGQHFEIAITTIGELRGKMYRQRWGGYYGGQELLHKTQKPVELLEWCIRPTEGIVIDYFSGSGTTLIACQNLGRKCRGIEIDPGYVAVSIQRFFDATGIEPVLLEG